MVICKLLMYAAAHYMREFLFNSEELKALVADLSDEELHDLHRGAHDPVKVYAAYAAAVKHKGQPTVILSARCERLWSWVQHPQKVEILRTINWK